MNGATMWAVVWSIPAATWAIAAWRLYSWRFVFRPVQVWLGIPLCIIASALCIVAMFQFPAWLAQALMALPFAILIIVSLGPPGPPRRRKPKAKKASPTRRATIAWGAA